MSDLALILSMGAGVFALRLGGLALPGFRLPGHLQRALPFVPVALLAALVVSILAGPSSEGTAWYIAAGAGGLVAYLSRRMWACIIAGLICYWLLQVAGLS